MALSDRDLAIAAAETGAEVVRAKFDQPLARFEKAAHDFATAADIEAERAILDVLRAARPDDAVVGEESGRIGPAAAARTWLVDPLCGTLNYAARTTLVAVNVTLVTGSDTTVGVAVDPFRGEVFWTEDGRAWVRRDGVDRELVPSPDTHLVDINLDPLPTHGPPFEAARLLLDAEFNKHFRSRVLSTTLALTWVAAGRRAAYVTDGDLRGSVHFTGAIALCQAAGCVVTGLQGQPLHTGVGGLLVAADHATHATLLEIIGRLTAEV